MRYARPFTLRVSETVILPAYAADDAMGSVPSVVEVNVADGVVTVTRCLEIRQPIHKRETASCNGGTPTQQRSSAGAMAGCGFRSDPRGTLHRRTHRRFIRKTSPHPVW